MSAILGGNSQFWLRSLLMNAIKLTGGWKHIKVSKSCLIRGLWDKLFIAGWRGWGFLDYPPCEQHSALDGRKRLQTYCSKFSLQTTDSYPKHAVDDIEKHKNWLEVLALADEALKRKLAAAKALDWLRLGRNLNGHKNYWHVPYNNKKKDTGTYLAIWTTKRIRYLLNGIILFKVSRNDTELDGD